VLHETINGNGEDPLVIVGFGLKKKMEMDIRALKYTLCEFWGIREKTLKGA